MATLFISNWYRNLVVMFLLATVGYTSAFKFENLGKERELFQQLSLYGDAAIATDGNGVAVTKAFSDSWGRVMYRRPLKLAKGSEKSPALISTNFSFSISTARGGGFAFVMVPARYGKLLSNSSLVISSSLADHQISCVAFEYVGFDESKRLGSQSQYVGIASGSTGFLKVINLPYGQKVGQPRERIYSWIDFDGSANRVEMRLSEASLRPDLSTVAFSLNLSKLWYGEEVLVGFSSKHGQSRDSCYIYSWSFNVRHITKEMHSNPIEPKVIDKNATSPVDEEAGGDGVLGAVTFFLYCVAAGSIMVAISVYIWNMIVYYPWRG